MAQTTTARKRVRRFFGKIREVATMPNLIEVQKASYDQFLQVEDPKGGRSDEGLQAVFRSVFPISDFSNKSMLEFVKYEFEPPKYDVDECRQRGMTFAAPLKVTLLVIEFDAKDIVHARIDRRRKIPVTSLLFALGMDGEEILSIFYKSIAYVRDKDGWRVPYDWNRMKGAKPSVDLIDADSGEVVVEAGKKLTAR